ncbi:MAG: molybdopterin-dependent oxidoreductase [Nitriliruptorales bacterium]|nr:molybdopterin-dependent oxidoreductase [Nitriliruptorales bacterium]
MEARDLGAPVRHAAGDRDRLLHGGRRYVADLVGGSHAWMAVVRSHVANGVLRGIDTAAARASDGVLAVLTAKDLDPVPRIPVRNPEPALEPFLQPILATERVRYVGEPIAVVVATDPYRAEDAAELVVADVDPSLAHVEVWDDATAAAVWASSDDAVMARRSISDGDVEAAFAQAAVVVRRRYHVARQTGLPMEPRGLIAAWDGDPEPVLHLWGVTKYVHFTRRIVAQLLGLEPSRVVVNDVDVGGMFGVRGEVYPEDVLVPLASRRVGMPVAWVEDRREHLLAINHSRGQTHDFELAMAEDGTFLAYRDRCRIDVGAYARPIGSRAVTVTLESLPGPYRWQSHEATVEAILTNKTPHRDDAGAVRLRGHLRPRARHRRGMRVAGTRPLGGSATEPAAPQRTALHRAVRWRAWAYLRLG